MTQAISQNSKYDYSLSGANTKLALEKGLADADWYASPIAKEDMRELLKRKDGPALRDSFIWFGALFLSGYLGYLLWGSVLAVIPFMVYGVIYASSSDSRWHECAHGTAFKTDWLNNALYEIASFMVFRESTVWRWSHNRHHTDTIIKGRDPEIAVPRPANIRSIALSFFKVEAMWAELKNMCVHAQGKKTEKAATFVPEHEWSRVFLKARIYLGIYGLIIGLSVYYQSWLPLMYVGLPSIYGSWLMVVYGLTQHTGLAEDVTDHRLNSRTVYMNPINRFLYWNMNYHVEHHMFPLVPYHALPKLHKLMKADCPKPYDGLWDAWKEIIPAVIRQSEEPDYYVERVLPAKAGKEKQSHILNIDTNPDKHGWIKVANESDLRSEEVIGLNILDRTFALYKDLKGAFFASDGICTHGNTHLSEGLVKGQTIECPKHNGRFDIKNGQAIRQPACVSLKTYPVKVEKSEVFININTSDKKDEPNTHEFEVVSNRFLSPFIKELVLKPLSIMPEFHYEAGDYIQLAIPAYKEILLSNIQVEERYAEQWKTMDLERLSVSNRTATRRNYSLASNPNAKELPSFTVRLATPPSKELCPPGVGSSYVFNLQSGDKVSAIGPYGTFHINQSSKEMVYLGGGAGIAPLRAHLSCLFDTQKTRRKVSFWYGARTSLEIIYEPYFLSLAKEHENFSYHVALSGENNTQKYAGGFIHEYLLKSYLDDHADISNIEFYICGPPLMLQASLNMLAKLGVSEQDIRYDDFGSG